MFKIAIDATPLTRELVELGRKMPGRLARGMNFAIYDAKAAVQAQAPSYIDQPTPWTTSAIFATYARPDKLSARVGYRAYTERGTAPEYYMPQLSVGGGRNPKKIETKLKGMGMMDPGQWTVFGKAGLAKYADAYGNLQAGKYRAMLRSLAGGNKTKSGRTKRATEKQQQFWVPRHNGKPLGVMVRWGRGKDAYGYFLKYVDDVQYRAQYPFLDLMRAHFDQQIERALYRAIVLKK